jgi:hypothetical protein
MPEIGLGIGSERASFDRLTREWLYWYDENNRRYPTPDEQIERADRLIEQERQRADRLEAKLRALLYMAMEKNLALNRWEHVSAISRPIFE